MWPVGGGVSYLFSHPPALYQVEAILSSEEQRTVLLPHVDQLLRAVLMQMKLNFTTQFAAASDSQARKGVSVWGRGECVWEGSVCVCGGESVCGRGQCVWGEGGTLGGGISCTLLGCCIAYESL